MINQEGCVNTLSMECMDFYYRYRVRILILTYFYEKKPLDMEEMVQTTPVEQYLTVITMRWITVAPYWTINPRGI